jgi:FRG domain-containing protein
MRASADITVESWNELNDRLYEGDWDEKLRRHRPTFVYHGQASVEDSLRSALGKMSGDTGVEEHLLRSFRRYASGQTQFPPSQWMWLALGRHHGLPTRFYDCSHSPQVALHFAVSEPAFFGCDAAVWCIDYRQTNRLLPAKVQRILKTEGSDLFTVEMLDRIAANLSEWDALSKEVFLSFWEPPSLDDRIINQYAVFAFLSNRDARLDEWLREHLDCYRRIRIPAKLKWEIRDRLDQANITERILFPGLDGLCRWLTRYYSPRVDDRGPRRSRHATGRVVGDENEFRADLRRHSHLG